MEKNAYTLPFPVPAILIVLGVGHNVLATGIRIRNLVNDPAWITAAETKRVPVGAQSCSRPISDPRDPAVIIAPGLSERHTVSGALHSECAESGEDRLTASPFMIVERTLKRDLSASKLS